MSISPPSGPHRWCATVEVTGDTTQTHVATLLRQTAGLLENLAPVHVHGIAISSHDVVSRPSVTAAVYYSRPEPEA
ncbi:hypothetical protein ACXR2U_17625 [Jatrophihabitans sp. YIM 134969]